MTREHDKEIGSVTGIEKTPKMLQVEVLLEEDLGEYLKSRYLTDRLSASDISQEITELSKARDSGVKVTGSTILAWLRKYAIPRRTRVDYWQDSDHRRRMREGIARSWGDPERKERRVARTHSPEANRRRVESRRRFLREHPEAGIEMAKKSREARKQAKLRRMREALGENPAEELKRLRRIGFSYQKIGERIGVSRRTVWKWLGELGADKVRKNVPRVDAERKKIVQEAWRRGLFSLLEERRYDVLASRYLSEEPATLEELGRKFGVTKQMIGLIENSALKRLKRVLEGQADREKPGRKSRIKVLGEDPAATLR